MEDNAYNRKISDEVKRINERMIASDVAKGYMIDDANLTKNVVRGLGRRRKGGDWDTNTALMTEQDINKSGAGWFDDVLGVVTKVAPLAMMALGKPKKTKGRSRKGGMNLNNYMERQMGGISTGGISTGGISTGGGWFDDVLGVVTKVAPLAMMALGKPKKTRGRPKKMAGISTGGISTGGISTGGISTGGTMSGAKLFNKFLMGRGIKMPANQRKLLYTKLRGAGMSEDLLNLPALMKKGAVGGISTGGNWLSDFGEGFVKGFTGVADIASKVLPLAGLGKKKPVGRPRKEGSGWFDDVLSGVSTAADVATKVAPLFMGKGLKGKNPVGRPRKGGISTGGMTRKVLYARPVGGSVAELEGSGWFDDVLSGISTAVDVGTKVAPLFMGKGLKGKKGGITTGGISTGGKKGQSKWITHVKNYANKHNINYRDALRDPKCKSSYKK